MQKEVVLFLKFFISVGVEIKRNIVKIFEYWLINIFSYKVYLIVFKYTLVKNYYECMIGTMI